MSRLSPDFKSISNKFDFNNLEQNPHAVFALSDKLEFIYLNQAWFDFARENDGEPEISNNVKIGSPFLNSISGELKGFYAQKITHLIENHETWQINYECSSKDIFRFFREEFFPFENKKGVLIINSLLIERLKIFKEPEVNSFLPYLDNRNFYHQCSNCRKTKMNDTEAWDWIPSLIDKKVKNISHTICGVCFDYYWK